jgi:hypothetical protein
MYCNYVLLNSFTILYLIVLLYNEVVIKYRYLLVWFMTFNATFNNISVISWRSVLLMEETGVPGENPDFQRNKHIKG